MERLERQQAQLELDALWDAKPVKATPQHVLDQVDLHEFGVADFVPILVLDFVCCLYVLCYCIMLLANAGCFLRTFLVSIFLHCCMFDND